MDYKEKYEKALEWMKSIYPTMQGSDKEDAEHYFPELAESEGERIRLFICDLITRIFWGRDWNISKKDCLTYLEKQKEQKPEQNSGKELLYVSNKSYDIGFRDGKREAEQKTAEWSEADEVYLQDALWCVEKAEKSCKDEEDKGACWSAERWLKSLRPSWKPSDEQMEALRRASTNEYVSAEQFDILVSLYEQLKKL